jgi:hypothetical protein
VITQTVLSLVLVAASAAHAAAPAAPNAAAKPAPAATATAKTPSGKPAAPEPKTEMRVVEPVSYDQLKDKVGREVVVITTLGTHRRGTLLKISNAAVIVKLDPKAGGIELDIPRDTVRSVELISVPVAVPEAEAQTGGDSAKKK